MRLIRRASDRTSPSRTLRASSIMGPAPPGGPRWRFHTTRRFPLSSPRPQTGSSGSDEVAAQHLAGDDEALDLGGPLADLAQLHVTEVPLHGEVPQIAVASVDLDGLGAGPHPHLRGE